jgi:flavin reductase (DIM6/NTAB) family NADH-FMN oxidoreductase RutF
MTRCNDKLATEFRTIRPKILYFGTPVAIVSSLNLDGTANLAPISSFWALGWKIVLGLSRDTQTLRNLEREPECVLNLPDPMLWQKVEKLAPLTGLNPVPQRKAAKFRYERDKFSAANFTRLASECVAPPRIKECPAHLEGVVRRIHSLGDPAGSDGMEGEVAVEVDVLRVHVRQEFVLDGDYVDATRWQPLIYNFRHYYGLGSELGKTFRAEV